MYKRNLAVIVIVYILVGVSTAAFASEANVLEGMKEKFWRGAVNTFTGWVEFPAQVYKGYHEGTPGEPENRIGGILFGLWDGIVHSAGRTLSGVFDLAGFWAADPKNNRGVGFPLDAELAWQEGRPYDMFHPDFQEGALDPTWNKLARGSSGLLGGFMEIPGQVAKGMDRGGALAGLGKGVWYGLSRGITGLGDLVTLLLPSPEETAGVAFDEEWPWDAFNESL